MMFKSSALIRRWTPLGIALALVAPSDAALAQSRRDRAAAEALNQRMLVAESRYREALVKVGNSDPAGIPESNAALEDMEDIVIACGKQKGCVMSAMLTTYKRLLKGNADGAIGDGVDTTLSSDDAGGLPTGQVPQGANASALLSADGQRFVRMVQFNPAVQAGIRRWLTDMRVSLIQSHENYQYMRHLMSPSFQRNGLPEALLFGIMAKESNGKVHVGSRAGAVGPMQFMPATGRRFGLGPDGTGFDTRYDPRASADAAASYLNERFAQLNNNIEMSLAAYNGGEGRAIRIFRATNGRNFWDADVYNQFPPETKDYVPMVIAAAWLYLHPAEYGLTFPKVDNRPALLKLSRSASIHELTICLGNGGTRDGYMRVLRNLNPRHEPGSWIPAGATLNVTTRMVELYNRHCIQGPRAALAKQLVISDANAAIVRTGPLEMLEGSTSTVTLTEGPAKVAAGIPAKPRNPAYHRVERGDTLVSIAQKYQCDTGVLARTNDLKAPRYALRAEQRLKLEGCQQ